VKVQAEISLYPLGEPDLLPPIEEFLNVLKEEGLEPRTGSMSSIVVGESGALFPAIAKAFERIAVHHRCVLVLKYSNACPPAGGDGRTGIR
jgi:uncharacterized protein YqgV (UPF0045/DUF77 family)